MSLFSSIGALVGMVAGGGSPIGAALGSGLGSLLSGGSMEDAFKSGIGALLPAAAMGQTGLMGNLVGAMGGGTSPQTQGAAFLNLLGGGQEKGKAMGKVGGTTGAVQGIMQSLGLSNEKGQMDPVMGGILMEMLNQQRRPRFENLMSDRELSQYETGERRPDYRGTAAPGTPVVSYRPQMAEGGYIQGPGTGTSDSIPAMIYQNGGPVQEARLSDGEFVMTADAVRGAGGGNRNAGAAKMYQMMNQFERMA